MRPERRRRRPLPAGPHAWPPERVLPGGCVPAGSPNRETQADRWTARGRLIPPSAPRRSPPPTDRSFLPPESSGLLLAPDSTRAFSTRLLYRNEKTPASDPNSRDRQMLRQPSPGCLQHEEELPGTTGSSQGETSDSGSAESMERRTCDVPGDGEFPTGTISLKVTMPP